MSKGDYVVYERASRNEDRLLLEVAKEATSEIKEPRNWKRPRDPNKHAGGKKVAHDFRTMLLILLLMVYHRKEYREMESHLNNDLYLLKELNLEKSPGKSTIQRAAARISLNTLVRLNGVVVEKFKKKSVVLQERRTVTIDSSSLGIRRKSLWHSIRTHLPQSVQEKGFS